MTITLTKTRLAVVVLAIALIAPATALATHVFDDVDDSRFYADAVEWAASEGITTGVSPTRFAPEENVTRGQNVTFLKRYHDNLVAPADTALQGGIDANADAIGALVTPIVVAYVDHNGGSPTVTGTPGVTATWNATTNRYTVTVDGVTLTPTTYAVNVMSIRINAAAPTQDRSAQTYFNSGSVEVGIWDASIGDTLASGFHITIYEIPS